MPGLKFKHANIIIIDTRDKKITIFLAKGFAGFTAHRNPEVFQMRRAMKIAVLSDTHDNIWNLRKALEIIKSQGVQAIVHCGDIIAPFVFREFEKANIPVHCVFGNNDGDKFLLTKTAYESKGLISIYGIVGEIDFDGFSVAFTHEPQVAEGLAATGKYDLVCFGHTHIPRQEKTGKTILLNPGDLMGKENNAGLCIVDTQNQTITRLTVT
jgi:hypothetical protein